MNVRLPSLTTQFTFASLAFSSAALAQGPFSAPTAIETFDSDQGALASYVLKGEDGVWRGEFVEGCYRLSNSSDPGAVEYVYITSLQGIAAPLSANPVSVDISGTFANPDTSQAGVMFNLEPRSRHYYAFMVKGGNEVSLVLRDAAGFRELAASTTDALRPGMPNRLTVVPSKATLRFLVNDVEVMSVESPSLPAGGVGIIATGTGTFAFDNLGVSLTPAPAGLPAPPQPPNPPSSNRG